MPVWQFPGATSLFWIFVAMELSYWLKFEPFQHFYQSIKQMKRIHCRYQNSVLCPAFVYHSKVTRTLSSRVPMLNDIRRNWSIFLLRHIRMKLVVWVQECQRPEVSWIHSGFRICYKVEALGLHKVSPITTMRIWCYSLTLML